MRTLGEESVRDLKRPALRGTGKRRSAALLAGTAAVVIGFSTFGATGATAASIDDYDFQTVGLFSDVTREAGNTPNCLQYGTGDRGVSMAYGPTDAAQDATYGSYNEALSGENLLGGCGSTIAAFQQTGIGFQGVSNPTPVGDYFALGVVSHDNTTKSSPAQRATLTVTSDLSGPYISTSAVQTSAFDMTFDASPDGVADTSGCRYQSGATGFDPDFGGPLSAEVVPGYVTALNVEDSGIVYCANAWSILDAPATTVNSTFGETQVNWEIAGWAPYDGTSCDTTQIFTGTTVYVAEQSTQQYCLLGAIQPSTLSVAVNAPGLSATNVDFNLFELEQAGYSSLGLFANFGVLANGGASPVSNVGPGSYDLAQAGLPTGYTFVGLECLDQNGVDQVDGDGHLDIDSGDDVTCTLTLAASDGGGGTDPEETTDPGGSGESGPGTTEAGGLADTGGSDLTPMALTAVLLLALAGGVVLARRRLTM